jgi:hypothetical protein
MGTPPQHYGSLTSIPAGRNSPVPGYMTNMPPAQFAHTLPIHPHVMYGSQPPNLPAGDPRMAMPPQNQYPMDQHGYPMHPNQPPRDFRNSQEDFR